MANYHDTSWRLTFQNVRLCTILEHQFLLTDPKTFSAGALGGGGGLGTKPYIFFGGGYSNSEILETIHKICQNYP